MQSTNPKMLPRLDELEEDLINASAAPATETGEAKSKASN
jgi:hypothetical protein